MWMHWILLSLIFALAALVIVCRKRSRPRRRHTPHNYIPPCIEK